MAFNVSPDSLSGIQLRRTITTSGWYDLGTPRRMVVAITGGGGGGGGGGNSNTGGGGGGGAAGCILAPLFLGGRVYISLGAGGTAGTANNNGGAGSPSFFMYPNATAQNGGSSLQWASIRAAGGGFGGGGNSQSASGAGGVAISTAGMPSITGYTGNTSYMVGDSGSSGGGGGGASGSGTVTTQGSFYPNITTATAAAFMYGWLNNQLQLFGNSSSTTVTINLLDNGILPGFDNIGFLSTQFNPTSPSYIQPLSLWTTGVNGQAGRSRGGTGGDAGVSNPAGQHGGTGMFTGGGGGGGGFNSQYSGNGGSGGFYRGAESSVQSGSANTSSGGGAGIAGPGLNGASVSGSVGSVGGAGGLGGGGGGGGGAGSTTGGAGGAGGAGACLIFW